MARELKMSQGYVKNRGDNFCRGCLGNNLFSGINLGNLPLANELLTSYVSRVEVFPLHLKICSICGLGQVADVVTPERIFTDYRYLSSVSSTFLQHASDYVEERVKEDVFGTNDWVLEIASNDGYLLRNFLPHGIRVVGIEPAKNVAEISRELGIETISEFFTSNLARKILSKFGSPRLIIANNVMAHVPDLLDFVKGLAILSGPLTRISIENPSLKSILIDLQFDTIYHEHYSYLSASAVHEISKRNGLQLVKVEELAIHGGSNRYWLASYCRSNRIDESVGKVVNSEKEIGLFDSHKWQDYSTKVKDTLNGFRGWLNTDAELPRRIYGYGAAAKASTILNSIGSNTKYIRGLADASQEKQSRFMPPLGMPIMSPQELFAANPTDVVVFPWNISHEIVNYLRPNLPKDARLWQLNPQIQEIT